MSATKDSATPRVGNEVGIAGIILAALTISPAVPLSFRFRETVAQFESLFQGFGADLPALTQFLISHASPISIAFRACVVCQLILLILLAMNRTLKARRAFWLFAILTLGATLTTTVAFYLPIFQMGAVV